MLKMPGLTALISRTFSVSLELGPFFCSLSRRILLLLHLYLDAAPVSAEGYGGEDAAAGATGGAAKVHARSKGGKSLLTPEK